MNLIRHASRFVVVGVINTGVYYGVYLLLNQILPYLAAHLLALGIAMVVAFFLHTYWTFQAKPTWKKFAMFPLTNLTNYLVQTFGLAFLVETIHVSEELAPLVASLVAIPITFLLSRRILVERPPAVVVAEALSEDEA